jgi:hypothetical protein
MSESPDIFVMNQTKEPSAGIFQLPKEFDTTKYAAQWTKQGSEVDAAQSPQPILGTNYGSVGWKVWQYPSEHKLKGQLAKVPVKNGTYVLMFRPRSVQDSVNAIYGNVSKQHLIREQSGESIAGQLVTDPGILTDDRIRQATGITEFGGEGLRVQMNPISSGRQVEAQPAAQVET